MRSVARLACITATLALLVALPAEAAPDRKACIAAADDGQKYRDEGKLSAAREMFIACSSKGCPAVVSKQCAQWLQDAEKEIPTVTFRAKDEQQKEIVDVKVSVDGLKVLDAIDAKPMPIDPGEHTIRFDRADGKFVEDKVIIRAAEKNRVLEIAFPVPGKPKPDALKPEEPGKPPEPGTKEGFKVPLLGWVGLGVGVAGGVTMAAFALSASSDESDLRGSCAPTCPESERDGIDTKIVVANVGLVVGAVGLAVGVVATVIANSGKPAAPQTGSGAAKQSGVRIVPLPLGLAGTF